MTQFKKSKKATYSKHLNRRDTHINQHSRQKMIQIKRETHVLINTAQKTVHNNLQHALNNRDTPNLATCLFYKDLENKAKQLQNKCRPRYCTHDCT